MFKNQNTNGSLPLILLHNLDLINTVAQKALHLRFIKDQA